MTSSGNATPPNPSRSRASVLSPQVISAINSHSGRRVPSVTDFVVSDLGALAVRRACEDAGIPVASLGMVIGETASPEQTIPGLSHRVAKRLDLKTYSYDLFNGFVSLPQIIASLLDHKRDSLPEYIACVCSNMLTPRVSYAQQSLAGDILGDAASAVILSPSKESPLRAVSAVSGRFAISPQPDRFQQIELSPRMLDEGQALERNLLGAVSSDAVKMGVLGSLDRYATLGLSGTPNVVNALSAIDALGYYHIALGDHAVEVHHA